MASGLLDCGAQVVITGRNAAKNARTVAALASHGDRVLVTTADLTDDAAAATLVAETVARFGRLDILINNAGTNVRKRPELYTPAEFRSLIDTNLTSAFLLCQAAYPAMKAAGGGKIINIGSMTSIFGVPFAAPYSASKGGIVQLSQSLATAWAADNIQVNAILPGWIDTDLTQVARRDVPNLNDNVLARTPARRWGRPADLAGTAVYLASAASDFVTGVAIPIDGGYSALG